MKSQLDSDGDRGDLPANGENTGMKRLYSTTLKLQIEEKFLGCNEIFKDWQNAI